METDGAEFPNVPTTHHSVAFDLEYVPIDNLAVAASLPLYALKYSGGMDSAFGEHGRYDDGDTHFTFQDLRVDARYSLLQEPIAGALSVGVSVPVTRYEVIGAAAAGRGLKQAHFGLSAGWIPTTFLPRAFVFSSYEFTWSERFETEFPVTSDYNLNRSNVSAVAGYYVLDTLQVFAALDWQIPHGGMDFVDFFEVSQVERDFHDPLTREGFLLLGGGAAYSLTDELSLSGQFRFFLSGSNTRNSTTLGIALGYALNIHDLVAGEQ